MSRAVYIISMVGESPSVLSELLWHLRVVEGCTIAGVEVWATGRGADALERRVGEDAWAELEASTGPLPPLLELDCATDTSFGFRVHKLRCDGRVLDDVRSQPEAVAVSAALHDRVRELRDKLAPHIQLVGSLAGGRKTVSAALQTAFCMQAGVSDRLVHVLLDPRLEDQLRSSRELQDYCCPTPAWAQRSGVPEQEQVLVYDVAFPRVKHLVHQRLQRALATEPYNKVWPELERHFGRQFKATLHRVDDRVWHFSVVACETQAERYSTKLGERSGALFAAICLIGGKPTAKQLIEYLDSNDLGWRPTGKRDRELPPAKSAKRHEAIRGAASLVRTELADIPAGLEAFALPARGYAAPDVTVTNLSLHPPVFDK